MHHHIGSLMLMADTPNYTVGKITTLSPSGQSVTHGSLAAMSDAAEWKRRHDALLAANARLVAAGDAICKYVGGAAGLPKNLVDAWRAAKERQT